eukprot:2738312-Rhodomonas_salina.1
MESRSMESRSMESRSMEAVDSPARSRDSLQSAPHEGPEVILVYPQRVTTALASSQNTVSHG